MGFNNTFKFSKYFENIYHGWFMDFHFFENCHNNTSNNGFKFSKFFENPGWVGFSDRTHTPHFVNVVKNFKWII